MKTFWCATCERFVDEVVASNFHQGHRLFEELDEQQQKELREAQDAAGDDLVMKEDTWETSVL